MTQVATAEQAWSKLVEGNKNFVSGLPAHKHQDAEKRRELVGEQTPFAAVFGCSDSRLAAEMIFDVGLGDLFVVRNAGQVLAETILGSLEFAVEVIGVPLILILGHDQCGAIKAGMSAQRGTLSVKGEFIHNIVNRITPTIERGLALGETSIDEFTNRHIKDTIQEMTDRSEVIREAIEAGRVAIVGAQYKLELGEVQVVEYRGKIESTR
jgi:carbonic anhydrase